VYWFAVANMPQDAVFADEKSTVEQIFTGWHCPIAELIAATDAEAVHRTPIADLSTPLPRFHRDRVVLLGDAAHAMTPNPGQGGGQALEDAAALTALLAPLLGQAGLPEGRPAGRRGRAVPEAFWACLDQALRRYDALRRPRSQSIAKKSRLMGQVFQLGSPLLAGIRDAGFAAVSARRVAARAAGVKNGCLPGWGVGRSAVQRPVVGVDDRGQEDSHDHGDGGDQAGKPQPQGPADDGEPED